MKQVFTTGQAARLLGCSTRTVNLHIDKGTLEGYRIANSTARRVHRNALLKFMEQYKIPAADSSLLGKPTVLTLGLSKPLQVLVENAAHSASIKVHTRACGTVFEVAAAFGECLPVLIVFNAYFDAAAFDLLDGLKAVGWAVPTVGISVDHTVLAEMATRGCKAMVPAVCAHEVLETECAKLLAEVVT